MKVSRVIMLIVALGLLLATSAMAAITTTHNVTDAFLASIEPIQTFAAEGRIGIPGPGDFELDLGQNTAAPAVTAQFTWPQCQTVPFTVTYNPVTNLVTFTVGAEVLVYNTGPQPIPTDIFIRTRAVNANTSVTVTNIRVNGILINDTSEAINPPSNLDILRISGASLANGLTLTADANLCWTGTAPTRSRLAFQVKAAPLARNPVCFQPVTLTVAGWLNACNGVPSYPNLYAGFPIAFRNFSFFGRYLPNQLVVGGKYTLSFVGKTSCLTTLCQLLAMDLDDTCGPLHQNYVCPGAFNNGDATALAQEVVALALNIAFNDARLMPRSRGYDLEDFVITRGVFRGKTVGQVYNIANAVLGGASLSQFGLPSPPQAGGPELGCQQLLEVLREINADYAFIGINFFTDRGYLRPPFALGLAAPPHQFVAPVM